LASPLQLTLPVAIVKPLAKHQLTEEVKFSKTIKKSK